MSEKAENSMTTRLRSTLALFVACAPLGAAPPEEPKTPAGLIAAYTFEPNTAKEERDRISFLAPVRSTPPAELRNASPTAGRAGYGLHFGVEQNTAVTVPSFARLDDAKSLTVSAWALAQSIETANYVVAKEDWKRGAKGFVLRIDSKGQPEFSVGLGGRDWYTAEGTAVSTGEWHHLAATYEPGTIRLYVDGELADEETFRGELSSSSYPLGIGRSTFDTDRGFQGSIDEVAIWGRALSEDEIGRVHERGTLGLPIVESRKKARLEWPAPVTFLAEFPHDRAKIRASPKGQLVTVTWRGRFTTRAESPLIAVRVGDAKSLGSPFGLSPPDSVEHVRDVEVAATSDGTIHLVAGFTDRDDSEWYGYGRWSDDGVQHGEWINLREEIDVEWMPAQAPVLFPTRGGLRMIGVGRLGQKLSFLDVNVGRDEMKVKASVAIDLSRFLGTLRTRFLPSRTGQLWALSRTLDGLQWQNPRNGDATPIPLGRRVPRLAGFGFDGLVSRQGRAVVTTVVERSRQRAGTAEISFGEPGAEMSKPAKVPSPTWADSFRLVESRSDGTYLVLLTPAKTKRFGCDVRLEIWSVGRRTRLESRRLFPGRGKVRMVVAVDRSDTIHAVVSSPFQDVMHASWSPE